MQCLLDQFSTVADAVKWLETSCVQLIEMKIGGKAGTGHISRADPSGNSAIIEFLDGETSVHEGTQYTVMANEPPYEKQLEIQQEYPAYGGDKELPGGIESLDRFARAAYYSALLPQAEDMRTATAYVFSVIRNASAPFGAPDDPTKPNISPTRWRTVSDCTEKRYFFESTTSPNVVWVELGQLDFGKGNGELVLDLVNEPDRVGDVTSQFVPV
ncbi:linear amide C-N hydrolase [Kitasatospora sp. NPDC005856]|uniref:linear amide C-N hydrolase n=1 Tax=Kitasatospora sp. NPDC005856 TaxID=3154566 RepID=UPI0034057BB6